MKLNKKNKTLLLAVLLVFYLAWHFAMAKTAVACNENKEKEKQFANLENTASAQKLLLREKQADQLLKTFRITGSKKENFQNFLLKEMDRIGSVNRLNIYDFKEPVPIPGNQNEFYYIFTVEGNFNNTLKFISQLENNHNLGKIKSIAFSKQTDYKSKSEKLYAEIVLIN